MANKYLDTFTKNSNKRMEMLSIPNLAKPVKTSELANMNIMSNSTYDLLSEASGEMTKSGLNANDAGLGLTTGDMVGMAGTIAGSVAQISNSISAAKATKPNVNRFKGFNEKALAVNRQMQHQIEMNEATSKRDIERKLKLKSNTSKARNRGASSGISQMRALDLATDVQTNEAEIGAFNEIESIFGNQMVSAKDREAGLYTQQDQMVMSAEERKDIADQQDLDNAYTQYAQNIATTTNSIQKMGSDINQAKHRNDFLDILPDSNAWGIGYEYMNGINGSPEMTARNNPSRYGKERNISIVEEAVPATGVNIPYANPITDFDFDNYDHQY